ncbi:MAG: ABC transporter substrate-binding protein [Candidatus Caldarchaeum sp.]|nr:ABC transporter substrate-binding protein [Candidatus Caldarchaeum sp.]MDW8435906.1 ABC transporter substrate-binding protein [Candidatus Caldarchaeum sp.]
MVAAKSLAVGVVFLVVGLVAGIFLSPIVLPPPAPRVTSIKFVLDWAIQGPQAPFIVALEKGYFAQEGLAVTMDRGYGSADAITKVASGVYQMGYGSIDALIEFNVKNPGQELVAVYVVLNSPPYSVLTLKNKGINSPKDLEGKKIGAPEGDAPRRLFPVFAKATGIDPAKVTWVSMSPPLREPSLVQGEVDAITGFYFTGYLNLLALKVDPAQITAFKYKDFGVELYGNAIVVRKDFMQNNPEAVAKFVKAVNKALKEVIADPDKAADFVKLRDPLVDREVELQRLRLALADNIVTEEVRRNGLGAVDKARLERTIKAVVEAFKLPRTPSVDEIFTDRFLPPREERTI